MIKGKFLDIFLVVGVSIESLIEGKEALVVYEVYVILVVEYVGHVDV